VHVLTLTTQKGGSGKSTVAANLAVAAGETGERVFALELDRQGTLARWIGRRTAETPGFDRIDAASALAPALNALQAQGYTLVILDTPGADSPAVAAAIQAADLCLVPTQPTPADLEATQPTLEAIYSTRRKFAFVLNRAPPKGARVSEAASGLQKLGVLAEPVLVQRNDYQDALGMGQGVTEFAPDGKAAEEIRQLWQWIARRLKEVKRP